MIGAEGSSDDLVLRGVSGVSGESAVSGTSVVPRFVRLSCFPAWYVDESLKESLWGLLAERNDAGVLKLRVEA
jgi:hypothetical protein